MIEYLAFLVELDEFLVESAPRQVEVEHAARDHAPIGEANQTGVLDVHITVLG